MSEVLVRDYLQTQGLKLAAGDVAVARLAAETVMNMGQAEIDRSVLWSNGNEACAADYFTCDETTEQILKQVFMALDSTWEQSAAQREGRGAIAYLRQEGRGIGLINKIRAYRLQDQGLDTVEANLALGLPIDARDFGLAQQIFAHLGIRSVRLLTNNPDKVETLRSAGIEVAERVPLHVGENAENEHYLHTKAEKLGHMF